MFTKKLQAPLLLSGFFPRPHPTRSGLADDGRCEARVCSGCGQRAFSWSSVEYCPCCGIFTDHWQYGKKKIKPTFTEYGRNKMECEFAEAWVRIQLKKQGFNEAEFIIMIQPVEN